MRRAPEGHGIPAVLRMSAERQPFRWQLPSGAYDAHPEPVIVPSQLFGVFPLTVLPFWGMTVPVTLLMPVPVLPVTLVASSVRVELLNTPMVSEPDAVFPVTVQLVSVLVPPLLQTRAASR